VTDADVQKTKERQEVYNVLQEAGEPLGPKEVAELIGKKEPAIRKILSRMHKDGDVSKTDYGQYVTPPPPLGGVTPVTVSHFGDTQGANCDSVTPVTRTQAPQNTLDYEDDIF